MIPDLLSFLGEGRPTWLSLPSYFTLLMVGFALAIFLAARWVKRAGLDHDVMIDCGLYALIWGVVGGRVMHVIADGYFWDYVHLVTDYRQVEWHIHREQCAQAEGLWDAAKSVCRPTGPDYFAWAAFWRGGLAYYGGLLFAVPFCLWFLRKERMPVLRIADISGAVIPLGLFFGRLGCFFGGCCFGIAHDGWPAVSFPPWSPASEVQWRQGLLAQPWQPSLPVLPTQLFESLGCLAIFAALFFGLHPRKRFDGQVFLVFVLSYAVLRFGLEFLRADDRGGALGLSSSQLVSAGVAVVAVAAWAWLSRRAKEVAAGVSEPMGDMT